MEPNECDCDECVAEMPECTHIVLDEDEYCVLFGDVCDVVWRAFHDEPDDGIRHTSSGARSAAVTIFDIFGVVLAGIAG